MPDGVYRPGSRISFTTLHNGTANSNRAFVHVKNSAIITASVLHLVRMNQLQKIKNQTTTVLMTKSGGSMNCHRLPTCQIHFRQQQVLQLIRRFKKRRRWPPREPGGRCRCLGELWKISHINRSRHLHPVEMDK